MKQGGLSREENMITILIPDPTFSWQQQSVSLETNLEACEQCGPGLLISADTGSHYPGPGAKPKTAQRTQRREAVKLRHCYSSEASETFLKAITARRWTGAILLYVHLQSQAAGIALRS